MVLQATEGLSIPHSSASCSDPCLSINCFGHFHVRRIYDLHHQLVSNKPQIDPTETSQTEMDQIETVRAEAVRFETNKTRALLAYLAIESEQPHSRDKLTGLFWPEFPETKARHSLRQTLVRLRKSIGDQQSVDPYLLITRKTIQFNRASNHQIDVGKLKNLLSLKPNITNLDQAIKLYKGELLTGFSLYGCEAFEEWLLLTRESYHRQATEILQRLIDIYVGLEDYARVQKYTQTLLALNPWHEGIHAQLMLALALEGQRSAALLQYEECKRILLQEFDTPPAETTTALYKQILEGKISANPTAIQIHLHNIPSSSTPMFGRDTELKKICEQLNSPECRLVSLVGLGGMGKSRLAIAAAEALLMHFEHGIWFISLADNLTKGTTHGQQSVADLEDSLAIAIANTIGISFSNRETLRTQLFTYLQSKKTLLILDNFEHLINVSDFVVEILRLAPLVSFLVTTRVKLNIRAEYCINLSGLSIPSSPSLSRPSFSSDLEEAMSYGSIHLFVSRADCTSVGFELNEENLPDVIRICQLLDGLPLGIELAALWTEHFTCAEIVESIQENLDFLSTTHIDVSSRHRSLRAIFDYSWQLLSLPERVLLAQLSIFHNGFSRDAAMQITQGRLADLVSLTRHSLICSTDMGRYHLHEMVRLFAAEKCSLLESAAQKGSMVHLERLQAHHCQYYLRLVTYRDMDLVWQVSKADMAGNYEKFADIHQAWQWAVAQGQLELLDQSAIGLKELYRVKGLFREGRTAFASATVVLKTYLARFDKMDDRQSAIEDEHLSIEEKQSAEGILAKLLIIEAYFCGVLNMSQEVDILASEAIDIAGNNNAITLEVIGYLVWGRSLLFNGNYKVAKVYMNHAQTLAYQYQLPQLEVIALYSLGYIHINYTQKNYTEAKFYLERALYLCYENGRWQVEDAHTLFYMSILSDYVGIYHKAIRYAERVLEMTNQSDIPYMRGMCLAFLSLYTSRIGDYAKALDYNQQALQLALHQKNSELEAHTYTFQGSILVEMEAFQKATDAFQRALGLVQSLGLTHLSVISWAGLSQISLAQGHLEQALFYVEKILLNIERDELNIREPLPIYLTCYRTLKAQSDPRARSLLQAAYQLLQEQAMTMTDEAIRHSFLTNVITNRTICMEILTPNRIMEREENRDGTRQVNEYLTEKVRPDLKHLDYLLHKGDRFRMAPPIYA